VNGTLKCAAACLAIFVALAPQQVNGQDVTDVQSVLRRVELLEATQLRMLRELASISMQLAEGRKAAPAGPLRVSPPAPAIPSLLQSIADAATKGSPDAAVVLIEYADFQCPYCGQFARQILPEIEKRYVSTGKLRVVFKHMPLQEIHPQAVMAAETAECARQQGKFWQVHDALFADQRLDETSLVEHARASGISVQQFSECVRGNGGVKVKQDLAAAHALGLSVTPTFLIGRDIGGAVKVAQILTGVRGVDVFANAIESILNDRAPE
jgi:protein-disulfide isomerase